MEPNSGALEMLQRFARRVDEHDGPMAKTWNASCHAGAEGS